MKTKVESNENYHSNKRHMSSSGLKKIHSKSVYHYLNQKPYTSAAMSVGTMIHTAILEPENFDKNYHVMPKVNRKYKEGKELYAKHLELAKGKEVISDEDKEMVDAILTNFNNNATAVHFNEGVKELSFYSELEGVQVKVRPDCYNKEMSFMSDPKTCQDNSPKAFKRDVYKYGYHLQAAFYSDVVGIDPKDFVFTAIETKYPFSVECYSLSEDMIEEGRGAYMKALLDWKEYLETGIVKGYDGYHRNESGIIIL